MADAGRVLIMPKGDYDPSVSYEMLDLVLYNNIAWLAKRDVIGIEPSDANSWYWFKMIEGGGDADTLGGKGASEYALVVDLLKHNVTKYRGETKDEISSLYASFHTNAKDNDYYKAIISHSVSYDVLGGGTWYLEGVRVISTYGWQKATSYGSNATIVYERSLNNGVWTSWERGATTADLANYLPLTGGTVGEGQNDSRPLKVYRYSNTNVGVQFISNDGILGSLGFLSKDKPVYVNSADNTSYELVHANNVGSYALPISGGKVNGTIKLTMTGDEAHGYTQIYKNNSATVDNGTYLQDITPSGEKVWLGILAKNNEMQFRKTDGTFSVLLHTGNSAKVAIQASAPTDTTALWVY